MQKVRDKSNGIQYPNVFANNPEYNTARDLCRLRGIKSGIVSVAVENLIEAGYLTRRVDVADRRIQRLEVTKKRLDLSKPDGRPKGSSRRRC